MISPNNIVTCLLVGIIVYSPVAGNSLIDNSPFIPPGFNPPSNQPSQAARKAGGIRPGNLEFRGVYQLRGTYHFHIYNRSEKEGAWLALKDESQPYNILEFNEQENSVLVLVDGQEEKLVLKTPDNRPISVKTAPRKQTRTSNNSSSSRRRVVRPKRQTSPPRPVNNDDAEAKRREIIRRRKENAQRQQR